MSKGALAVSGAELGENPVYNATEALDRFSVPLLLALLVLAGHAPCFRPVRKLVDWLRCL